MAEAAGLWDRRPPPFDPAGDVRLDRPAVDPDRVGKARAGQHILAAELVSAGDAAGFANADLRRRVDHIGIGEARRLALEELEELHDLPAPLDLARGQFVGVGAIERT